MITGGEPAVIPESTRRGRMPPRQAAVWRGESGRSGQRARQVVAMPYLNFDTCAFTLAPMEAGLLPAGTLCCRGRASMLLRGTEAPQRAARRRALRRRGMGAVAGHRTTGATVRRAQLGDACVRDRLRDRLSVLDRVRVVLRIHAAGHQARKRSRAERFDDPF